MESHGRDEPKGPVLHIVVVGFHHKKGCQVEFSYPPLMPDEGHDSNLLPEEWRYLPFLSLPDGAHNYQEDTVYFHLPPRNEDMKCVYGVSCYRQIEAKALKVRQADVTRETVQKSVCVLSRVPLFGLLQAKLQLITHAYFEEKDFSQISILKELYDHMNGSLRGSSLEGSQVYLGLSPRDLILHFRHKVLILFKLILLEKKVLFFVSPVNRLVGALMTVLSLFPGMIEHGLVDSSHYRPKSSLTEDLTLVESVSGAEEFVSGAEEFVSGAEEFVSGAEEFVSVSVTDIANTELELEGTAAAAGPTVESLSSGNSTEGDNHLLKPPSRSSPESSESDWETLDPSVLEESPKEAAEGKETDLLLPDVFDSETGTPITVQPQPAGGQGGVVQGLVSGLEEDQYGLPLPIFTKGYLCLPYMALQQHHLLSDVTVRGFVAGATNILFRQQRHLSDAIVEVEEGGVHIQDPELRKILSLTTADLRFADYLLKHVTENRDDVFLDGTGWEGGDEWIRAQFTLYLHSLLSSALQQDNERLLADYGVPFVTAWKISHNYRVWFSNKHPAMAAITPGHPFQGQYSVADVKLRLSHSMQNSERGKKIGNAMMTTSRSVVQTGKAVGQSVGGALTSAKSAMSSWFSTLAQPAAVTTDELPEPAKEVQP
ncbi:late secretory pathway protein AVL9 homolog isoform X1 [Anarhichas minor]|uniref:late secretory pathway protein AVL9 homolog isoform X1 n=2 Tax=Anarhichas minor TaxID=65739 RepID=UPI003F73C3AF